jgi:hypothetical protein
LRAGARPNARTRMARRIAPSPIAAVEAVGTWPGSGEAPPGITAVITRAAAICSADGVEARLLTGERGEAFVIKAAIPNALGQPVLFLGLSGENVTRLVAGESIRISPEQVGQLGLPQMEVVIHYGRTEQAIVDELEGFGVQMRSI